MSTNSRFAVAVHVLSLMAWSGEEPLKSEQVAESVNTNPVVIRRMLLDLAQAGLVVSQTGSMGGSRLATDPAKTTLLDVYQALECGGEKHHYRRCRTTIEALRNSHYWENSQGSKVERESRKNTSNCLIEKG
jgi:DNA-binding IscR family transcriptional regulator